MDDGSLPPTVVLTASLVLFAYLTLTEETLASRNSGPRARELFTRLSTPLRLLRLATVLATSLALLALLLSLTTAPWPVVALSTLGLLVLLGVLQGSAGIWARRYPSSALSLTSPLSHLLSWALALPGVGPRASPVREPGVAEPLEEPDEEVVITEEEQASLDKRERHMIRSILRLEESTAREVMVPRVDIVAVEVETSLPEVANRMMESGHSRLPVYQETIDHVVGIIHARDILGFLGQGRRYPHLKEVIRPPLFTPESKRLDELLQEFQEQRVQVAIVVDEYGGTEGLVTLEDLLEEIVGEIEDEFSREEPEVVLVSEEEAIVDARATLDDLNELFSTRLKMPGVDTVGGFVYGFLGRIPGVGEEVLAEGLRIEVMATAGRRIRKLRITKTQPQDRGSR